MTLAPGIEIDPIVGDEPYLILTHRLLGLNMANLNRTPILCLGEIALTSKPGKTFDPGSRHGLLYHLRTCRRMIPSLS
jgi:hypothetical protein